MSNTEAHLSLVAVAPSYWGLGYGAAVLRYAEQSLAAIGYKRARLHVLRDNSRARKLYERCGWTFLGDGEPHDEGPQVVYEKRLWLGRPREVGDDQRRRRHSSR